MDKRTELYNLLKKAADDIQKAGWEGKLYNLSSIANLVEECIKITVGDEPQTIEDHVAKIRELAKKKHNCKVDVTINYHE